MAMVPNTTTVATATLTLCDSLSITRSVAGTAAAPQIPLPALTSSAVSAPNPNTPSQALAELENQLADSGSMFRWN